jgi:hypothetical protein
MMESDHLPTFLILGAAKCGTTSLAAYLAQHPDVFMPEKKEPNYFAIKDLQTTPKGPAPPRVLAAILYNLSAATRQEYLDLFAPGCGHRARGEASVRYLYFPEAVENIHAELPEARLVVMLRNPVDRVYSHYNMNRQYQLEPLDLMDALDAEDSRIAQGWGWDWHYAAVSRYAPQIARYIDRFGAGSVAVFLQEDLANHPEATFQAVCRHIGIDDGFRPDMSIRAKVSYRPRNLWLDRAIHWPHPAKDMMDRIGLGRARLAVSSRLKRGNLAQVPPLDGKTRSSIATRFREDVKDLADLLDRPLNWGAT